MYSVPTLQEQNQKCIQFQHIYSNTSQNQHCDILPWVQNPEKIITKYFKKQHKQAHTSHFNIIPTRYVQLHQQKLKKKRQRKQPPSEKPSLFPVINEKNVYTLIGKTLNLDEYKQLTKQKQKNKNIEIRIRELLNFNRNVFHKEINHMKISLKCHKDDENSKLQRILLGEHSGFENQLKKTHIRIRSKRPNERIFNLPLSNR